MPPLESDPTAWLVPILGVIAITPDPILIQIGPIPVYWYGIGYALGLFLAYRVITREAARRRLDPTVVDTGIIVVAIAALAGGRLYHVIDEWERYAADPLSIVLPPYTGLGVYGGIFTGIVAAWLYARHRREPFLRWADVIAPGLFVMQAVGRWGNFFNQELYGPPSDLPWAIAIDCEHRIAAYPCTTHPVETTAFHPLFLYESVSGIVGAIVLLWVARRFGSRLRPGSILLLFLAWYGVVRFALEFLRTENWTIGGIPTAQLISVPLVLAALGLFAWRNRPGRPPAEGDWADEDDDDWADEDDDWADEDDLDEDEDDAADDVDDIDVDRDDPGTDDADPPPGR